MAETELAENEKRAVRTLVRDDTYYRLKREIEEFYYDESEMLDTRRFKEWLDTLADDLVYFMPMAFNVKFGSPAEAEWTRMEKDMSWFNEGKWTLAKRVEQVLTGVHWIEEPLSRACRIVSNIQITSIGQDAEGRKLVDARNRFLIYQNRRETEEYYFVGQRYDQLRLEGSDWKLTRRLIHLPQNVLLAKALTMLF